MAQPEIPGFYFDPEKKKYFKIQRAEHAPREDCKYSQTNIAKERKKEKEEKTSAKIWKKRRKETIIRSSPTKFLLQASLDREINHKRGSSSIRGSWANVIASGFQSQTIVHNSSVRYFDQDPVSKTLYVVNGEASIQRRRPDPHHSRPDVSDSADHAHSSIDSQMHPNAYTFQPWDILAQMTSPVSSLNYLPGSGALCITTCGSDRSPCVYLTDPDQDGPFLGEMYTPRGCRTIWGSAPRPLSFSLLPSLNSIPAATTEHIAVSASNAMMLFTRENSGPWDTTVPLKLESEILALEWLSENTLTLGCRNGKILLYDMRSKLQSEVLKHPYPISKLRRADDPTRVVCSGLQNTCVLYDMRMARAHSESQSRSHNGTDTHNSEKRNHHNRNSHRKRKRYHNSTSTTHTNASSQPLLRFQHNNADDLELSLDVHPGLGLVAAAQGDAKIRISNLWTGKVVKEFSVQNQSVRSSKKVERIRCLRFMDEDRDGNPSLWVSWSGGVRRFGW